MSYSTFRGFLREQFPNLKLDAVTPAKHNSSSANTNPPNAAPLKIEENISSQ